MTGKKTCKAQNENAFVAGWSAAAAARLKAAIKRFGSQDKVSASAGISRQSLVEILRFDEIAERGSRPRYKNLYAICEAIGISEDDIIADGPKVSVNLPDLSKPLSGDVQLNGEDFNLIRQYEVNVSAGPGLIPARESASDGIAFARSWLLRRGIAADLSGLVKVKGDSMAPTIPDGAMVLVQLDPHIEREGIYVFSRDGEAFVKRLMPVDVAPDGRPKSIVIMSDNPEYHPEALAGSALKDIRIVGRVRTVLADL